MIIINLIVNEKLIGKKLETKTFLSRNLLFDITMIILQTLMKDLTMHLARRALKMR